MLNFTEKELKEYAEKQAKTIVIRRYESGNSYDDKRTTTEPEERIIQSIIYGALLAINSGSDKQSAKNTAEYIGDLQIPTMNGYDTIYNRIEGFFDSRYL